MGKLWADTPNGNSEIFSRLNMQQTILCLTVHAKHIGLNSSNKTQSISNRFFQCFSYIIDRVHQNSHSISNRFFQCFSCIIDRVRQKTPTVQIWWEQIEFKYRIPNLGQTIRNRPCNLGQTIRNRPCNLGQTIRICPCNSGRPIRTRLCNLGGAIRNSCFAKC